MSSRISRTSLRPRLEHLECRDCPACNVFVAGTTLFAIGDPNENQIDIALLGDGDIQVTCDNGTPQIFRQRIDAVQVHTRGGDDLVRYGVIDPNQIIDPDQQPTSVEIDLGFGNDSVELLHLQLGRAVYDFALLGGAGHDYLAISDEEYLGGPDTRILMDGGTGDDILLARLGFNPQPDPPGRMEFTAVGGGGNDVLGFSWGEAPVGDLVLTMDGGAGDDEIVFSWINPDETDRSPSNLGPVVIWLAAGLGNDRIDGTFVNPGEPDFEFHVDLGAGNDSLNLSFRDPTEYQGDPLPRHMLFDIFAGPGNDHVMTSFMYPRGPELAIRTDLGAGDDWLDSEVEYFTGALNLSVDGKAGNDNVAIHIESVIGAKTAEILGGAGDDSLGISDEDEIHDPGGPDTRILMDGGDGRDNLLARLGFNPQPDPPGRIEFTALGGAGNDHIDIVGFNPQPDPPGAEYLVNVDGGLGNDSILFAFIGLLNGTLQVQLDGGDGDDHVATTVSIDPSNPNSEGTIDIVLLGGRGNDVLSLVVGDLRGVSLRGVVDGGAGFDTAFIPNGLVSLISVLNCERIISF